jgi:FAD:protein FMN transferase
MRKLYIIIALVAALAFGAYLLSREEPLYHTQSYVFGTLVDITIYNEDEDRARSISNQILQDFQNLHNRLHAWKPISEDKPSELGELNKTFERGAMLSNISPDLIAMLADAKALSVKSHGLFNPAIGQLIGTWGFQRDEFEAVVINDRRIKALVKSNPSMSDIIIQNNTAHSENSAVKLDLGGYAKGYALDMAAQYLHKQHVNNALINIGGNIIAIGKHGEKPWRVGIQHPRAPTAIATLDLPDGWAIGTSGDYQRYFMLNGNRYCHIIDPRTGYPAEHTQSVTVLVPPQPAHQSQAGVLSDVASKPIFIELPQNRNKAAQELGIENFMVIDDQANIFVSKNMVTKLNWLSPNVKFTTLQ